MNDRIEFGEVDTTWSKYGLTQPILKINGKPSKYKAIMRDGEVVSIMGRPYQLFPNEEMVKIANQCAQNVGLTPFTEFEGDWIVRMNGKHTVYNRKKTVVHALYALQKDFVVGGDKMYVGVGVHNSIDGSTGLGVGCFSFRAACSNVVLTAGMRGWSYYYSQKDYGHTIETIYKRHTAGLKKLKLQEVIIKIMEKAQDIITAYELMTEQKVTDELVERLKKSSIPAKVLPEYITTDDAEAKALMDWKALTKWDTYNEITENIWHNEKTDIQTKNYQFNQLHRVMPLVVKEKCLLT